MRIKFTRTGGFVPMLTVCELETTEMPPLEARHLEALIYASGILQMSDTRTKGARDVALFTFEIQGGRSHKVIFDQLSVPDGVKPLLAFLQQRATSVL
jgi:hypothetical protein